MLSSSSYRLFLLGYGFFHVIQDGSFILPIPHRCVFYRIWSIERWQSVLYPHNSLITHSMIRYIVSTTHARDEFKQFSHCSKMYWVCWMTCWKGWPISNFRRSVSSYLFQEVVVVASFALLDLLGSQRPLGSLQKSIYLVKISQWNPSSPSYRSQGVAKKLPNPAVDSLERVKKR